MLAAISEVLNAKYSRITMPDSTLYGLHSLPRGDRLFLRRLAGTAQSKQASSSVFSVVLLAVFGVCTVWSTSVKRIWRMEEVWMRF